MTPLTKQLYFTTSTVIDWVDIFSRPSYRHIVVESLDYCQRKKGLDIYAWVLMTNHLHMVVDTDGGHEVGDILRDFKKFNHVEEIYTQEFLWQKINYIHQNPVRAEFVARPEDYLYSSAQNYAGDKGLLDVNVVRFCHLSSE